ncbi:GatB/YqeY domain-containing protein [Parenemella sanctibonifatiensis]|uniref:Glutamyl-tRNA amidotransferase n=1 Tax=Parenemella sanctibonifatiensis TaxID=2016505 RepID=A0A255EEB7_9ACTN|nr:GatB/YqeY domain-containing protein [Parenemella sanctibonifatiensis]OYN86473.1 glutamyl-tRNA amidotransferase [Parenemella sanctibonifatiensis]
MAALKDQIRTDMTKAMKERDKEKLAALRMLMAAIGTAETEGSAHELSDDEVLELVSREVKKRREAAEAFASGGRDQSAAAELTEAKVLSAYLPAQLSDDEIEQIVALAVAGVADQTGEKPGMRQMGQVMKAANAQVAGRAEGARVAAAVKSALA